MKQKLTEVIIFFAIILLVPAWLYASGNLPSFFPSNQRLIKLMQYSFPSIAEITYKESHQAYKMLRDYGVTVPYSYNERSLSAAGIRAEVIRLCDSILQDVSYGDSK
jgi:hypothetical protein